MPAYYLGLMSGTSADAIDVALVDFSTQARLLAACAYPLPDDYRTAVLTLSQSQAPVYPQQLAELDQYAAELFAQAVHHLLQQTEIKLEQIQAIGSHGQTLYHQPKVAKQRAYTWQIGDPSRIAYLTGITTVADFRRHDMAAGGQGAPLAPAFHQAVFSDAQRKRAVVNIGGIANITVLIPQQTVTGFDTGTGNALLDAWCWQHRQQRFDAQGQWAASAPHDAKLLARLLDDDYFHLPPPKSTGRDYFQLQWLQQKIGQQTHAPATVQATLAQLTATSISQAIQAHAMDELLVCGGGVHNRHLMNLLRQHNPTLAIHSTAHYGVDPDWLEAMCFAWLAKQRLAGQPTNLPSVTGASKAVLLGGIY